SVDEGWGGTDITPGTPPSFQCAKGLWQQSDMDATELFENSSRAADCHHYEVSELAKSKGWTEGKGALPRFAWIEYGKTFGEFDDEGLSNAGTAIYVGDEKLLIGNINE